MCRQKPFSKISRSLTLFGYSSCGLLLCHYLYMYVFDNKIEVLYRNNGKNNKILRTVLPDGSNSKYYPFLLFPFAFTDIIFGNILDFRHYINYDREILITPDKEILALDWDLEIGRPSNGKSMPIAIFLPGLTGDSASPYIRKGVYGLRNAGIRTVVFNPRGSIIPQKTINLFSYESIYDDLDFVVSYIKKKHPKARVYLVGFSLGSSYGLRYLADHQDKIDGMACVGSPFDAFAAAQTLNSFGNMFYS